MTRVIYDNKGIGKNDFNRSMNQIIGCPVMIDGVNVRVLSIIELFYSIDYKCFAAVLNTDK